MVPAIMTTAADPHPQPMSAAACPACILTPDAARLARAVSAAQQPALREHLIVSVPGMHCAGCISTVERGLERLDGVRAARVNLGLKRVMVDAAPGLQLSDIITHLANLGYEAHELDADALGPEQNDPEGRALLMRLAVSFFAMMNVMLLSGAVWSGAEDATRDLFHWISAAIALPTLAFAGQPFFASAGAALRAGRLGMDVPISLALLLSGGLSLYETVAGGHQAYFDAGVMLCFFLLAGRYLDYRSRSVARSAAQELSALEVPRATRLDDGVAQEVAIAALAVGDIVRVRPGGRMPVDGTVIRGESELDRGLLTGETRPVQAAPGSIVCAGEINLTGPLDLRVTAAGQDSSLARMTALVALAESGRDRYRSLADRAARVYAPLVHLLALAAFGFWLWHSDGDVRLALNIAVAVLLITCPCALGLAVPAVVTTASGKLFRKGFLIKTSTALERLAGVDTVVFDKTGTLTLGLLQPLGLDQHRLDDLALALALAQGSGHPLAQALTQALQARNIIPTVLCDITELPGHGIQATADGKIVRLGRADWVGAEPPAGTASFLQTPRGDICTFGFADHLRPGAVQAVAALQAQGLQVHLISGDNAHAVADFAQRLGITQWQANALPTEKAARVGAMQANGQHVLMMGDGLNDTAALATADVSIAPGSGLDAARVAADIVFLGQDLAPLSDALRLARQSRRRILQNFAMATIYNMIAVPLALAGLASPLAAAAAMSLSSISVSLNALRLR